MSQDRPAHGHGHHGRVECAMCLKEIPLSAAFTPEGGDYVGHFCGHACYEAFQRMRQDEEANED